MAQKFIDVEMGNYAKRKAIADAPFNLTPKEKDKAVKKFTKLDSDKKGYIIVNDLRRYLKVRV